MKPMFPLKSETDLLPLAAPDHLDSPDPRSEASAVRRCAGSVAGQALRILVVDDEKAQRGILAEILSSVGYQVDGAGGLQEALCRIDGSGVDLVLTDLKMPGGSGMDLLEKVKEIDPDIEVVLMTAFSSVETAVEAMRKGAHHYLPKPFSKEDLLDTVAHLRDRIHLRKENRRLRHLVAERFSYHEMLGVSAGMQEVFNTIEKVHSSTATVLIRGESGTGKELVARAVHATGNRGTKPFVAINCAAIPEMLIESELFGHEKGSFTGAIAAKVGRFEEVADGTLFLDEVGSMRYDLQAKLLRVIQEREFHRIGGRETLRLRGRIVAATSQDLESLVRENLFREDLYFRLNVVPIEVPALRDRHGDLPLLAMHFLEKYSGEMGKNLHSMSSGVLDILESCSWPGNVRELENVVQRMVVLADDSEEVLRTDSVPRTLVQEFPGSRRFTNRRPGPILAEQDVQVEGAETSGATSGATSGVTSGADAPGSVDSGPAASREVQGTRNRENKENGATPEMDAPREETGQPAGRMRLPPDGVHLPDVEADLIRQALEVARGKLEPAARLLGITYKTLQYRIKKYGLKQCQNHGNNENGTDSTAGRWSTVTSRQKR